jgi:hypothetical protein
MSQVQVPKVSTYIALGPGADSVTVTKLSAYMILVPGSDTGDEPDRQAHVYAQRIGRS